MSTEKAKKVNEIENLLRRFDSNTVLAAIKQADVDYGKVDDIKNFLAKYDQIAVQCAIAELEADAINSEIKKVKEQISRFSIKDVKQAAVNIGIADSQKLCIDTISCKGRCIMVMTVRCRQEMVITWKPDLVQQDELVESIAQGNVLGQRRMT